MSVALFREQAQGLLWLLREPGNEEPGLCSELPSPGLRWVGLCWGSGAVSALPQPRPLPSLPALTPGANSSESLLWPLQGVSWPSQTFGQCVDEPGVARCCLFHLKCTCLPAIR